MRRYCTVWQFKQLFASIKSSIEYHKLIMTMLIALKNNCMNITTVCMAITTA